MWKFRLGLAMVGFTLGGLIFILQGTNAPHGFFMILVGLVCFYFWRK